MRSCLILALVILVSIMIICVMVKFATEVTNNSTFVESEVLKFANRIGLITLSENNSVEFSERFPYVAAITRNSSKTWEFACFASVVLENWVVTSAHCRNPGSTHKVLLYSDFVSNYTYTYPIMFWRLHELFNTTSYAPKFDIAVAKINLAQIRDKLRSAYVANYPLEQAEASVWKTVSTMDRRHFLTNDFDRLTVTIASPIMCYEAFGVYLDDSLFCVDMSRYDHCFNNEFGPIFEGDRVVGLIAIKPRDCDMKLAIFTNVSYYTGWILKTTRALQQIIN